MNSALCRSEPEVISPVHLKEIQHGVFSVGGGSVMSARPGCHGGKFAVKVHGHHGLLIRTRSTGPSAPDPSSRLPSCRSPAEPGVRSTDPAACPRPPQAEPVSHTPGRPSWQVRGCRGGWGARRNSARIDTNIDILTANAVCICFLLRPPSVLSQKEREIQFLVFCIKKSLNLHFRFGLKFNELQ